MPTTRPSSDPFLGAEAVELRDEERSAIAAHGLADDALRTLEYMHDIEFHTACYMRDLLATRAHNDVVVSDFMMRWGYEETHHGHVLGGILEACGRLGGRDRVTASRRRLGWGLRVSPVCHVVLDSVLPSYSSLHMTVGSINEWTAQAAYRCLAHQAGNPALSQVLARLIRQEGSHAAFYSGQARRLLSTSSVARRVVRTHMRWTWRPVGTGVVDAAEAEFVARYLFTDSYGREQVAAVDKKLQQLPGLCNLHPLQRRLAEALELGAVQAA